MTSPNASKNKAAIVTGAAQGIGRATALRLAHDGYDVAVNDLPFKSAALDTVVAEIKAKGRKAIAVPVDISVEANVEQLVNRTTAELGILYVMVANAGIAQAPGLVVNMTFEAWNETLSVNLSGVFLCYRAAARQMLKQGKGGRIVGAMSLFGKRAFANMADYSASKFGVRGLTQALSEELAQDKITVNGYAPGFIDTNLILETDKILAAATGQEVGQWSREMNETIPVRRFGTADEVAGLVSYFASDEAGFVTGQSVSINGGLFYD